MPVPQNRILCLVRRVCEGRRGESGGRREGGAEREAGGLLKGGMERGLEAESTSFSRYNRGECTVRNGARKRNRGKGMERQEHVGSGRWVERRKKEERYGTARATRKRRGIRDFVCLPVRPSEPEGTSAAANLEELGRETNTSAKKRRRKRKGIVRIVG